GHHRLHPGRGQRGGGRARAIRRAPSRHAAPRGARLARDAGGRPGPIDDLSTRIAVAIGRRRFSARAVGARTPPHGEAHGSAPLAINDSPARVRRFNTDRPAKPAGRSAAACSAASRSGYGQTRRKKMLAGSPSWGWEKNAILRSVVATAAHGDLE